MNKKQFDKFALDLREFISKYEGVEEVSPIMYNTSVDSNPSNHKRFYTIIKTGDKFKKDIKISLDRYENV